MVGEVNLSNIEVFDSTIIGLFKEILPGADRSPINWKGKSGAKAFTKINLDEGVPNFVCLKADTTHEKCFSSIWIGDLYRSGKRRNT